MKFKLFFVLLLLVGSIILAVYEFNNPPGSSYQKYFDYGLESYNNRDYDIALDQFIMASGEEYEDGLSNFYIGLCYIELGDYENANYFLDLAIEYQPELQEKYDKAELSKYKDMTGDIYTDEYSDEIKEKEENYDLGFTDPKDYNDLGLAEYNKSEFETAIKYFEQALELDNEYIYAVFNIGLCYYYMKEYEKSKTQYTKALDIDDTYSKAYFERAYVSYELKEYQNAIDDYTIYIGYEPTEAESYTSRGLAKYMLGNTKDACIDWKKSKELGGNADEFIDTYCN